MRIFYSYKYKISQKSSAEEEIEKISGTASNTPYYHRTKISQKSSEKRGSTKNPRRIY
jgi:hypothetical protein